MSLFDTLIQKRNLYSFKSLRGAKRRGIFLDLKNTPTDCRSRASFAMTEF